MFDLYEVIGRSFYLITYSSYIVVALAFLYFVWGAANLILRAGDEEKRKENIKRLAWGLGILVIIFSIAGVINILQYTFQLDVNPRHNLIEEL